MSVAKSLSELTQVSKWAPNNKLEPEYYKDPVFPQGSGSKSVGEFALSGNPAGFGPALNMC